MSHELYKIHRPTLLKEVVGQGVAVKTLTKMVEAKKVPHTILFSGPSGCGKTTLARILAKKIGCGKRDFQEKNCADFRGIDMVRDIRQQINMAPLSGSCRVWLIDEAHQLSSAAQDAFLKTLEDTPKHVYFFLATTDPQKLKKTIRTRSTTIALQTITKATLTKLVQTILEKEGAELGDGVLEALVERAEGSARMALVVLDQILGQDEEAQLHTIAGLQENEKAIEIARALLSRKPWATVAKLIKSVEEDPEQLRWMILGYATSVLLGGGKMAERAAVMIEAFRDNFFDCKKAGLAIAAYQVSTGK